MRVLIIRGYGKKQNLKNYNSQELGLAKVLVEQGIHVDVAFYNGKNAIQKTVMYKGKEIKLIGLKGISILSQGIYFNLKELFSKYDYVWSNEANQFASYVLVKNNFPGNIYHGPYFSNDNIRRNFKEIFFNIIYRNKTLKNYPIYTKSSIAERNLRKMGMKNVKTIGVGLDISKLQYKESDFSKKNKILYIGAINKRKNTLFLLKVFNKLLEHFPNLELVIIGKGEGRYIDRVKKYIQKNNLVNKVEFFDSVSNDSISHYYNESLLFVLPTQYEIFGMVILESMYHGIPVITTNNGGSATVIKNYEDGIIIPKLNINDWVNVLVEYLANPSKLEYMGKNGREKVLSEFTWENILKNSLFNIKEEDDEK